MYDVVIKDTTKFWQEVVGHKNTLLYSTSLRYIDVKNVSSFTDTK